jgi:hypothetical protein
VKSEWGLWRQIGVVDVERTWLALLHFVGVRYVTAAGTVVVVAAAAAAENRIQMSDEREVENSGS